MSARAIFDPNVRVRDNQTFVGFEHCDGAISVGCEIEVWEREADICATGVVTDIDMAKRLVYIRVPWGQLAPRTTRASFLKIARESV